MISIRYSIPPPLISRYTSVISEATGFNYIAIHRHIVGFNPCFLEGRDYRYKTAKLISKPFQSTLPRRERRALTLSFLLQHAVSIHAPTKGATRPGPPQQFPEQSFNPRSHEGSDKALVKSYKDGAVSIHAPTKGATHGVAL